MTADIHFKLSGNEKLPVVALSHSLGSRMIMWAPQIQVLEEHFRVLRLDTRGHGVLRLIPNGTHLCNVECTEDFNESMMKFLQQWV